MVLLFSSCDNAKQEISTRFMNSKCTIDIEQHVSMAGFDADSISLPEIDSIIIENIIDSFPEDFSGRIFFHGKRRLGHLRLYTVLLDEGSSRSIHAIIVKGKLPISNIELASFGQSEVNSFTSQSSFTDDSTIVTRKFQSMLSEEAVDQSKVGDSIITSTRVLASGYIQTLASDTFAIQATTNNPNDEEYADEVFYFDGITPSSWKTAGITDHIAFKNFFMEFRNHVKFNDKDAIANVIQYPIKGVEDETAFVKQYDQVFTSAVKTAIQKQKIRQMYRDDRGVMVGDDMLWFREIKGQYKIVKIK